MYASLYTYQHSAAETLRQEEEIPWRRHLPEAWAEAVIPPLWFKTYDEYEIAARKQLGYDTEDRPCFYTHAYLLKTLHSDDGEDFYETTAYGELVCAWRMRDDRWLIFRITHGGEDCRPNQGFYAFSQEMPR